MNSRRYWERRARALRDANGVAIPGKWFVGRTDIYSYILRIGQPPMYVHYAYGPLGIRSPHLPARLPFLGTPTHALKMAVMCAEGKNRGTTPTTRRKYD